MQVGGVLVKRITVMRILEFWKNRVGGFTVIHVRGKDIQYGAFRINFSGYPKICIEK